MNAEDKAKWICIGEKWNDIITNLNRVEIIYNERMVKILFDDEDVSDGWNETLYDAVIKAHDAICGDEDQDQKVEVLITLPKFIYDMFEEVSDEQDGIVEKYIENYICNSINAGCCSGSECTCEDDSL